MNILHHTSKVSLSTAFAVTINTSTIPPRTLLWLFIAIFAYMTILAITNCFIIVDNPLLCCDDRIDCGYATCADWKKQWKQEPLFCVQFFIIIHLFVHFLQLFVHFLQLFAQFYNYLSLFVKYFACTLNFMHFFVLSAAQLLWLW